MEEVLNTETTEVESVKTEEVAEPKQEKPKQDAETNAKFRQMRLEKESKEVERLKKAAGLFGYKGDSLEELAESMEAEHLGITVEELRKNKQQEADAIKSNPQYQNLAERANALEAKLNEVLLSKDLEVIKKYNPEEKADSIYDLGETFLLLMSNKQQKGQVTEDDIITAYEMTKIERERKEKPPKFGSVNNSEVKEKDFYTSEEVDRLKRKDLDNPKIMEKVLLSMTKW